MRRLALLAAALLAVAALPSPASADPPPPPAPSVDDDVAPPQHVDGDTSSFGFGDLGGASAAAEDTDTIQSGQGFFPSIPIAGAENYGAFRFQMTSESANGIQPSAMYDDLQSIAAELTGITQVSFAVDTTLQSCGSCNTSSQSGTNFRTNEPIVSNNQINFNNIGLIRVRIATTSPCGPLVPIGEFTGVVGCTNFNTIGSPPVIVRGSVWLSPSLFNPNTNADIRRGTMTHEIGHALGLAHFPDDSGTDKPSAHWPSPTSPRQLMFAFVHGDPNDIPGAPADHFHNGDRNGVWFVTNDFGWYLSATYQDFLGRIPDNAGYRFWFTSNQSLTQYLVFLTTSDEWVGRIVDGFYLDVLGRPNTDQGARTFWMNRVRQVGVPQTASDMYASAEYFGRTRGDVPGYVRNTNDGFVRALYHDLLGREVDQGGLQFWVGRLNGGASRQAVALQLYQSFENRLVRVRDLYCTVLDRGPEGDPDDPPGAADDGWTFWARQILTDGDLSLARSLAASDEYGSRADTMALRSVAGPATLPAPCTGF